jgi:hypothetical protein
VDLRLAKLQLQKQLSDLKMSYKDALSTAARDASAYMVPAKDRRVSLVVVQGFASRYTISPDQIAELAAEYDASVAMSEMLTDE